MLADAYPARETEAFGQAVDKKHIVLVNVDDVVRCRDRGTIAIACVVIASVKFVHNESRTVSTNVLDFSELWILDDLACWVSGVRSQDY